MTETLQPDSPRVLILIPAYNEAAHIAAVVRRAAVYLPVCVVDDGSKDETVALAEQAGAVVLRQVPNQGKGAALRAGFRKALEEGWDAVITLDADGQHEPEEIPAFLDAFSQRAPDLLIGARDFSKMPFVRRLGNTLGGWLFSWAVGQRIVDNQSGYRLLSRRLMSVVLDSSEQGFEYEVEMIVRCIQNHYHLDWVEIRTIYADEKSHIHPVQHALGFLRLVRQTRRRMNGG